ncbi:MAG: CoA pyrophosphatase [Candidatus Heimdallarchaeota archaeon]|nr:CoA pyrophosphatase [Candidatus Heimdallarchaeota archaeon]
MHTYDLSLLCKQTDRITYGVAQAAVLIPFIERDDTLSLLLTKRADSLRKHPGQISFPGGKREAGESVFETAIREAEEEIGLSPASVEVLGLYHDFITPHYSSVTPIITKINPEGVYIKSATELDEILIIPLSSFIDPISHEVKSQLFNQKLYHVHHYIIKYKYEERLVWGATAGVINSLVEEMRVKNIIS